MASPLELEMATYEKHRGELLACEGQFVVIKGEEILGTYATYEDALKVGYDKAGLHPFLVKRIQSIEPINFISRSVPEPCLT